MENYRIELTKGPRGEPLVAFDIVRPARIGKGTFALGLGVKAPSFLNGLPEDLVLKVFKGDPASDAVKADFEMEYDLLQQLVGCSHAVQLYGCGTLAAAGNEVDYPLRGKHLCLLESRAKEIPLDTAVECGWLSKGHSGPPEPAEKLAACAAIADAVAEIASRGVVQRDLGANNVYLRRERGLVRATLIDFGNGQIRGTDATPSTDPNIHLAKWETGAPEMFPTCEYYSRKTEPPVDVYSLGAVSFWLLSGTHPFNLTLGPQANARSIEIALTAKRNPPQALPAHTVEELGLLGPRVSDLVTRCLSYRPQDRPMVQEVAGELRRCLSDLASTPVMPQGEQSVAEATPAMPQQESGDAARVCTADDITKQRKTQQQHHEDERRAAEAKEQRKRQDTQAHTGREDEAHRKEKGYDFATVDDFLDDQFFDDLFDDLFGERSDSQAEPDRKKTEKEQVARAREAKRRQSDERELKAKLSRVDHIGSAISRINIVFLGCLLACYVLDDILTRLDVEFPTVASLVFSLIVMLLVWLSAIGGGVLAVLEGRERAYHRSLRMEAGKRGFQIVVCLAFAGTFCGLLLALGYFYGDISWLSQLFSADGVVDAMCYLCIASSAVASVRSL